jgi:hypothetical protein
LTAFEAVFWRDVPIPTIEARREIRALPNVPNLAVYREDVDAADLNFR